MARVQLMISDNTHIKYLSDREKKGFEEYSKRLEAQEKFDNFLNSNPIGEIKPNKS